MGKQQDELIKKKLAKKKSNPKLFLDTSDRTILFDGEFPMFLTKNFMDAVTENGYNVPTEGIFELRLQGFEIIGGKATLLLARIKQEEESG